MNEFISNFHFLRPACLLLLLPAAALLFKHWRSLHSGQSWQANYILRDDGPDSDLGYPSSVELADGSILTVFYQKVASAEEKCSLMWTRWELPK